MRIIRKHLNDIQGMWVHKNDYQVPLSLIC